MINEKQDMLNEKYINVEVIDYCNNPHFSSHMNWFTVRVDGFPRSQMQELSRHTFAKSIESSRYTLKKHLKGHSDELLRLEHNSDDWGKYVWLVGNNNIDYRAHSMISNIAAMLEDGASNDMVKTIVPEGLRYSGILTFTIEEWRNLASLRTGKDVYLPFRIFVEKINSALILSKKKHKRKKESSSPLIAGSSACRVCWDSTSKSDNGGPKDIELLKRVTIKYKHQSILEHLKIRSTVPQLLHDELFGHRIYSKYIEKEDGTAYILINMRTIVEAMGNPDFENKGCLIDIIPDHFKYLVEGEDNE
jgi:thymidylate synthase ThyX